MEVSPGRTVWGGCRASKPSHTQLCGTRSITELVKLRGTPVVVCEMDPSVSRVYYKYISYDPLLIKRRVSIENEIVWCSRLRGSLEDLFPLQWRPHQLFKVPLGSKRKVGKKSALFKWICQKKCDSGENGYGEWNYSNPVMHVLPIENLSSLLLFLNTSTMNGLVYSYFCFGAFTNDTEAFVPTDLPLILFLTFSSADWCF